MHVVGRSVGDASPLFEVSADMRVPRRRRNAAPRGRHQPALQVIPMPTPQLTCQPDAGPGIQEPLLQGMAEVGTGLLDQLDAMQRVAASASSGPLLVNASPGAGKTHLLIRRIAYFIRELGIPANQCLVLAASPRATERLRGELAELLHDDEMRDLDIRDFAHLSTEDNAPHLFIDDLHLLQVDAYRSLRDQRSSDANITATGDPDSALAGQPEAFENFHLDFPDARVVRLSRNHRNPAAVLVAACQLIEPISRVPGRITQPQRPALEGAGIGRFYATGPDDEAAFVARLRDELSELGVKDSDVAIIGQGHMSIAQAAEGEFRVVCCTGLTAEDWPDEDSRRRELYVALSRSSDLAYVSHTGPGSPLLADLDQGLFTPFGTVGVEDDGAWEQPRLL
ncbi:UvrD-helicase domain-containing protein [Natronoglycomyces albus]|uniref:AAA family ATPase n=1 Tax=Natronoglycomyces albus TaxID=2811108 RepID=A0A895XS83_9ACTN|nr:UvrD-helicase domain-containing protein [Natronoglycomyces albus]QSB05416.1 AAA family ATPase [Natronoglycomyces albus]